MSFSEIQDAVAFAFADGFLSEEEFLILYNEYKPANRTYPYWEYDAFCLDDFSSSECESHFRIMKDDIPILADSLRLPRRFVCSQGTVCDHVEGLCMLLKRLTYPCRYFDLISTFGRPVPELCMITNTVQNWIYENHGFRLSSWNQPFLSRACLQEYAAAVSRKGTPLTNCFGFIDGTVRPICRPGINQNVVYNGHKRVHALKFQAVAIPNGLLANLYGPIEGCRHDAGMLRESGLLNTLERIAFNPAGDGLCLYGDPAYPLRPHLMCPYRLGEVPVLTPAMMAFNESMSSVRVSVEWLFRDVADTFKFIDFKKNLKLDLSAVGKQYILSSLFRNILTCLYGNSTSSYFQLDPPTIDNYLS